MQPRTEESKIKKISSSPKSTSERHFCTFLDNCMTYRVLNFFYKVLGTKGIGIF